LGSGYHRDFQLLKEPLMRGLSRASEMLEMLALGVAGLTPDRLRGAGAIDAGVRATGEALRRAQKGTPFREAYQQVSRELGQGLVPPSTSTATIDLGPIKQRLAAARRWSRSAARIR
jgi:argininosuccinate lyase